MYDKWRNLSQNADHLPTILQNLLLSIITGRGRIYLKINLLAQIWRVQQLLAQIMLFHKVHMSLRLLKRTRCCAFASLFLAWVFWMEHQQNSQPQSIWDSLSTHETQNECNLKTQTFQRDIVSVLTKDGALVEEKGTTLSISWVDPNKNESSGGTMHFVCSPSKIDPRPN